MKTAAEKTETDKKIAKSVNANANKSTTENERTAAESDTKIKEKNKQIITAAMTAAEINAETKRVTNFKFKKNIRLLTAIQMMLKVLLIFQMSLLCFHVNQSSIR